MSSPELQPAIHEPNPESEKIFEGVIFRRIPVGRPQNNQFTWVNSDPSRKRIELAPNSKIQPQEGRDYNVLVTRDTKPEDPTLGKYIVEIISTDWPKVESNVDTAEVALRQASKRSREIHRIETLKNSRSGVKGKIMARAMNEYSDAKQMADNLLGALDSPERELVSFRKANLVEALQTDTEIKAERAELLKEESEILAAIKSEPGGTEVAVLGDIRKALGENVNRESELLNSNPEAFFGLHLQQLREYKKQLQNGRIVEMPYVKEKIEDIVAHLKAGKPVLVYGHLGAGKTELAMHVAREYLGKEALVISGSKNISLAEFYGHQVLAIDKIKQEELDAFAAGVEEKFEAWTASHKNATEDDKNRAHDTILQTYLSQLKGGTISDFFLGPVYRAMEEGRPIIIDEVNGIPHEILISLNHILTRKPGDRVNVQQDSGKVIEIQEGFGILMTGNLNQGQNRYIDRQDMDPALLSRLYKVEYDYLPQKTEGRREDEITDGGNELFQLLVARAMDRHGNLEVPIDTIQKLWHLAEAARITQNVFAGREVSNAYYFREAGGRAIQYFLKESVLSMRALDSIIGQWQKEGYRNEIDHYIWTEFISQSTSAADRAYLYQLFKDRFGFFSVGWDQNPNYGTGGVINVFDIKDPENRSQKPEFFGPRYTVQNAFGNALVRREWPKAKSRKNAAKKPN